MTLTFTRFIPRQGREKERMEVEVARRRRALPGLSQDLRQQPHPPADGQPATSAASRCMDLYVSPHRVRPGRAAPRAAPRARPAGIGRPEVRFVRFDLQVEGNALVQMAAGRTVTVGAAARGDAERQDRRPAAALPPQPGGRPGRDAAAVAARRRRGLRRRHQRLDRQGAARSGRRRQRGAACRSTSPASRSSRWSGEGSTWCSPAASCRPSTASARCAS